MISNNYNLRITALNYAVDAWRSGGCQGDVLEIAQKFYEFLVKDQTSPPAVTTGYFDGKAWTYTDGTWVKNK